MLYSQNLDCLWFVFTVKAILMIPCGLKITCFLVSLTMSAVRVRLAFYDLSKELNALKMSISSQKSKTVQQYERGQKKIQTENKMIYLQFFGPKFKEAIQPLRHYISLNPSVVTLQEIHLKLKYFII